MITGKLSPPKILRLKINKHETMKIKILTHQLAVFYLGILALFITPLFICAEQMTKDSKENGSNMQSYLYDENHTRFQLVKSVSGNQEINFVFLPGGPGVDSSCFNDLVKCMDVPGNYWLIDLPFNGTNEPQSVNSENICQQWDRFLVDAIKRFENPVLIGHSFGGYLPLFCPELEDVLRGLIILNSVPTLHSELFAKYAKENDLPSLSEAQTEFVQKPSLDTMHKLYMLESYYFFSSKNRMLGVEKVINKLEYCISTEHWWYVKGFVHYSEIKWVPQKVPTLIVGGTDDNITPLEIFSSSPQFQKNNIKMINIDAAGHFPWIEQPEKINDVITSFINTL